MAKTKAKSLKMEEPVDYEPSLYIDLDDPEDVSGLEIGKEVTVVVKGKIERISLEKGGSCLTLSPFEAEVVTKGAFEELFEDD